MLAVDLVDDVAPDDADETGGEGTSAEAGGAGAAEPLAAIGGEGTSADAGGAGAAEPPAAPDDTSAVPPRPLVALSHVLRIRSA